MKVDIIDYYRHIEMINNNNKNWWGDRRKDKWEKIPTVEEWKIKEFNKVKNKENIK